MTIKIIQGNAYDKLKELDSDSADMLLTSPPYYKKRINLTGDPNELGNEDSVQEYLDKLIAIFKEARRVVKYSFWVNIGDGFNSAKEGYTDGMKNYKSSITVSEQARAAQSSLSKKVQKGYPEHSLLFIPEQFALRMVTELGLCCRAKIIWYKPNCKPEGNAANRRFNVSYENLYWFTKQQDSSYYFEPQTEPCESPDSDIKYAERGLGYYFGGQKYKGHYNRTYSGKPWKPVKNGNGQAVRRKRDVWFINTQGYPGAHFSVYPEELCKVPILSCCPPDGGTVLDPFAGTGTTGLVAAQLGRNFVGVELNRSYIDEHINRRLALFMHQEKLLI